MLVCFFIFACEAAGASRARHSLRPLISESRTSQQNSGTRREIAKVCLSWRIRILPSLRAERSNPWRNKWRTGLLRGACHRARIRANPLARNEGVHLAPLAGRGRRRRAAKSPSEGTIHESKPACDSPSPARKMLATSPRTRGEVKNDDAERAHPHIGRPADPPHKSGWDKKERASRDLRRGAGALNGRIRHWTFSHRT